MKVDLSRITAGERDRADLGDIAGLAASIREIGLLHPVVVTEDYGLVAGQRRMAAAVHLGWDDIPVTIVDLATAAAVLKAELDENTCRKPLTPYEASRARERRAKVLAEDAKQRQREHGATAPGRPNTSPNLGEVKGRETAKVAAIGTGYSGSTLDKVDKIRDAAERGIVRIGSSEIPTPEPVREIAEEALEEVKRTGAAVDSASRKVDQALADYIGESADVQRARLRSSTWKAIKSAGNSLPLLDAVRVAEVCDDEMWLAIASTRDRIVRWAGEVGAARPRSLRVVSGGQP